MQFALLSRHKPRFSESPFRLTPHHRQRIFTSSLWRKARTEGPCRSAAYMALGTREGFLLIAPLCAAMQWTMSDRTRRLNQHRRRASYPSLIPASPALMGSFILITIQIVSLSLKSSTNAGFSYNFKLYNLHCLLLLASCTHRSYSYTNAPNLPHCCPLSIVYTAGCGS
jgi:hypothetical protein